jgi:hypothetical protein
MKEIEKKENLESRGREPKKKKQRGEEQKTTTKIQARIWC